jgi:hypothetical protein
MRDFRRSGLSHSVAFIIQQPPQVAILSETFMLDLFHTDDAVYYQGVLYFNNAEVVSMVVEAMITKPGEPARWEWMVWATGGAWQEPDIGWQGSAASLDQAKLDALDAAAELAIDLIDVPVMACMG